MPEQAKKYGRRWRMRRLLGRGGQGLVYEVDDTQNVLVDAEANNALSSALSEFDRVHGNLDSRVEATDRLIKVIQNISRSDDLPRGALKELLPIDDAVNAKKAVVRAWRERQRGRAEIRIY
jgi:hypothetical protein